MPFSHTVISAEAKSATSETNEVVCFSTSTWWYKFTPTQNGTATITSQVTGSTIPSDENNIVLGFYVGTTFPLIQVGCQNNNNIAGRGESATINLAANTTYYLQVSPLNNTTILDVTTSISFVVPTPPANDDLANAIDATGTLPFSHTVLSSQADYATNETNEAFCSDSNVSWWYKVTPTQNGTITVVSEVTGNNVGGQITDIRLGIYTGGTPPTFPLTEVICTDNDYGVGFGESETINVTANTTY